MSVASGHKKSSYGSFFYSTIGGLFCHCPFLLVLFKTGERLKKDFEIYTTKSVGDAESHVRKCCENSCTPTAYIACGGDGTFNEVLNGVYGFENACAGVFPIGTGNDFCRNFEDCDFLNIEAQFQGIASACDVICYSGVVNGQYAEKYCANMLNIGFDCNVADLTAHLKKYPFIKGSLAYFISILAILIKKKGADLIIEADGIEIHRGKLLLTAIANGCFCGGGIKSNPFAKIDDGLMDINIIKNIPRHMFVPCLPLYMKGTLFDTDKYSHLASTMQCKNITIKPNPNMRLCVDGEIFNASEVKISVISKAINILKPINCIVAKK